MAATRPLVWLHGEVKTPPSSREARLEAGYLLRRLQEDETLTKPHSGAMSAIGRRCHELRIKDQGGEFRIMYRIDPDAIVILEVFKKTTRATPRRIIDLCKERLNRYEAALGKRKD